VPWQEYLQIAFTAVGGLGLFLFGIQMMAYGDAESGWGTGYAGFLRC